MTNETLLCIADLVDIIQHAENAQHAFSSEQGPTLHLALPALEALHKAWTARISREKYADFKDALTAGINKIVEYYDHTADSHSYTVAMREPPPAFERGRG